MNTPKAIRPLSQDKLEDFNVALDRLFVEGMSPLAILKMASALSDKANAEAPLRDRLPRPPDTEAYETLHALMRARVDGDAEAIAHARSAVERKETALRETYSGDEKSRRFLDMFAIAKEMAYGDQPLTQEEIEKKLEQLIVSYRRPNRPRTH